VVDGNGVAIAAELMDEFFHLLAKVVRAAGGRATNCHFCRVDDEAVDVGGDYVNFWWFY
jgi:hypothetical protein